MRWSGRTALDWGRIPTPIQHGETKPALAHRRGRSAPPPYPAAVLCRLGAQPPLLTPQRRVLLRLRVPAVDVRPRRLARPRAVGQQALLEQRRLRPWVAALPAWAHPELVQRPVDR